MVKKICSIITMGIVFLSSLSNVKAEEINTNPYGKPITIYKNYYENNQIIYSVETEEFATKSEVVGKLICQTEDCKVLSQKACITDGCKKEYDKYYIFNNGYAVVSENNKYVIYDYKTGSRVFGPYGTVDNNLKIDNPVGNPLFYFGWENYKSYANTPLYAIGIYENNSYSVYSLLTKKIIGDIKGNIPWMWEGSYNMLNINDFVGKNILIVENNKVFSFVSLENGKEMFKINNVTESFMMNDKMYILARGNNGNKVYDSTGKLMFDGNEIILVYRDLASTGTKWIVVSGNKFRVYEKDKLINTSKNYDVIYAVTQYENVLYALVKDGNKLNLIDSNENIITIFSTNWNGNSRLDNGTTLEINDGILSFNIITDGTAEADEKFQKFTFDFKSIVKKTCPNDAKINIQSCIDNGETEEACIKKLCPGTEKVENPKTGLYIYTGIILVVIMIISVYIVKVKRNYFSKI